MDGKQVIARAHEHRMWVNKRLIRAAEPLTEAQLRATFDIGQGSIWRTLTHLFAAEYVWLEAVLGHEQSLAPGDARGSLPGNQQGADAIGSLAELTDQWSMLDERWRRFLDGLDSADFERPVTKVSTSSGKGLRFSTRLIDVLLHVCTHAQYTTAQLNNMLRRSGAATVPDVMLITMAREAGAPGD